MNDFSKWEFRPGEDMWSHYSNKDVDRDDNDDGDKNKNH